MRLWWRHETASVKMALVTAGHHSYRKAGGIEIGVQAGTILYHDFDLESDDTNLDDFDAPAPVTEYVAPAPAVTVDETTPVIEYVTQTPTVFDAEPAPVTYHVAFAPLQHQRP